MPQLQKESNQHTLGSRNKPSLLWDNLLLQETSCLRMKVICSRMAIPSDTSCNFCSWLTQKTLPGGWKRWIKSSTEPAQCWDNTGTGCPERLWFSILADAQIPTGHSPGQAPLAAQALKRGWKVSGGLHQLQPFFNTLQRCFSQWTPKGVAREGRK